MKRMYLGIILLLLSGCQNDDKIILWDYQAKAEIEKFGIVDSDCKILSQSLICKNKLRNLEPYKYLIIKTDSFYSEAIDLYRFNKKEIDTIYFENRYHDGSRPIKYEESFSDMQLKEKHNILRLNREKNILNLIECLKQLKHDHETNALMLSIIIHDSGKIIDYNWYGRDSRNVPVPINEKLEIEAEKCMINQGEIRRFRTARNANIVTENIAIPIW